MEFAHLPVAAGTAFLVVTTLMVVLRPVACAIGWVDRPGGRKTHLGDVPVTGGVAMYGGLLIAASTSASLGMHGTATLVAAGLMVLVGTLDDRFDFAAGPRLLAHLVASIAIVIGTGFTVSNLGNLFGLGNIGLGFLDSAFTVLACMALINACNMLDGLDGLAGGVALLGFLGFGILAIGAGATVPATLSFSMSAAIAAFLFFNVPALYNRPFRAFMGDSGSTLLGFVLACVGLALIQPGRDAIPPVLVLWILAIPIFELFNSTARRLANGVSPFKADAEHFHHQLLRAGFSVRSIFILYFVASAISVAIGLVGYRLGVSEPVLFGGLLAAFLQWSYFVRNARRYRPVLFPRQWTAGRQVPPPQTTAPLRHGRFSSLGASPDPGSGDLAQRPPQPAARNAATRRFSERVSQRTPSRASGLPGLRPRPVERKSSRSR